MAQGKIKNHTSSSIRNKMSPRVASASGVIPETTAHTVAKGGKRVAHLPKLVSWLLFLFLFFFSHLFNNLFIIYSKGRKSRGKKLMRIKNMGSLHHQSPSSLPSSTPSHPINPNRTTSTPITLSQPHLHLIHPNHTQSTSVTLQK